MTEEQVPTEASKLKFAQPQAAKPRDRAEEMPPLTDELCPVCHVMSVVRKSKTTFRIGEHKVEQCRVGHKWSPKGGKIALELLAKSQEKMRKARAKVPTK